MENVIKVMIELGKLYDELDNKPGIEDQRTVYQTAKLYLEFMGVSVNELRNAILEDTYINMFDDINYIIGLLTYMEYKQKKLGK
ncbi:MAG: hypothetical protein AB7S44_03255 [Spirochaetales bacterium]